MVDLAGVRLHDINFPGFKNKKIKLQKPLQILDGLSNLLCKAKLLNNRSEKNGSIEERKVTYIMC